MQKAGYHVVGPIGADSVFHQAKQGRFAAVLSLYHDQGHVACKTLDFDRTISLTLGMPILRTSVDHGTAFDIAGQGVANETGMVEAILAGARYAPKFATL
jgi:4-hydroxythreonine-4-phosphate dehydrogenase